MPEVMEVEVLEQGAIRVLFLELLFLAGAAKSQLARLWTVLPEKFAGRELHHKSFPSYPIRWQL